MVRSKKDSLLHLNPLLSSSRRQRQPFGIPNSGRRCWVEVVPAISGSCDALIFSLFLTYFECILELCSSPISWFSSASTNGG